MTTREFESRVSTKWVGYGTFEVAITFAGKKYTCTTHNTSAVDRISCEEDEKNCTYKGGYTYKGALLALWNECKSANGLRED